MNKLAGYIFIFIALIVAFSFTGMAMFRPLTGFESVLLQVISLFLGILGSYILGRESATNAGKELIKPHAKSAFRRLLSLYYGLSKIATVIQGIRTQNTADQIPMVVLDKLEVMVIDQIRTADDALDDWHDIVPEDVEQLQEEIKKRRGRENRK